MYVLLTASVPAVGVPRLVILLLPISIAPDMVPPVLDNLAARLLVTVVENDASLPSAAANSLSVSRADGAEATRFEIDVST